MMDNINEVSDKLLRALKETEKDKLQVARAYNKMVKDKSFQVSKLVWKRILSLGMKNNKFDKWSPNWAPHTRSSWLSLEICTWWRRCKMMST